MLGHRPRNRENNTTTTIDCHRSLCSSSSLIAIPPIDNSMPKHTPDLPSLKRVESESPPPSPVKNIFERLSENESTKICECLSATDTVADIDPVIVMDYRHDALLALRNHYAGGAALPAFLLGVVPCPVTSDALALAITTAVANGRGVVVSPRLISGLSAGDAANVCTDVTVMVRITLAADILTSGGGNFVDLRHMVSRNRMPLNDIVLTTITH